MENQNENTQQKKVWITPELIMESFEGTEGKVTFFTSESPTLGAGPS